MHSVFGRWRGARGVAAALVGLVMVIGVLGATARGQTPTPDATLRAYRVVEKHVREWSLPPEQDTPAADAPRAVGACVTLKLHEKVVGRGQAWSGVLAGADAPTATVLGRAIRAAMQQAEPEMGVPNDALRDAAIKLVAPDVLISVELAGPLSVVEFDTWDDAELTLRPGLDGVAVRVEPSGGKAAGALHALFPGQMMLSNMLPHRGMGAMAAIAMGEGGAAAALDDPKKLRDKSGLRMYRFRVGQVVGSNAGPKFLARGSDTVVQTVARKDLVAMADRLAVNLCNRSEVFQSFGVVPVALSAGVAHRALHEYVGISDAAHRTEATKVQAAVSASLRAAVVPVATEADRVAIGIAQAVGRTGDDARVSVELLSLCTKARTGVVWSSALPEGVRGCFLLGRLEAVKSPTCNYSVVIDDQDDAACIEDLLRDTADAKLVTQMPWLGWAEIAIARRSPKRDIPAAIALRHMRDECWKHQLSITDAGEDAMDMAGGIVFTGGAAGGRGNPYPTWQCVRPLAFMATMLRDPRLTEANERSKEIVRLMQAARFLRQLQVDESSAWMYPDPKLAIGGIRASTWDNSLPVDATSMTLLFTVELIKSLDELSAAKAAEQGSPVAPVVPAK